MRVHLIDGTYELFRAHHSRRPSRLDPDGHDVKATVGLVDSLLALCAHEQVSHIAVAFDNPIESFRNRMFAGYKDSSGVDKALLAQFDRVEQAVRALRMTVWSMDEFEADDALASAAARFADDVDQVRVFTPDKDLGQVVRGRRVVQVDRAREREFDADGVVARLGVPPASVPDLLALVGDSADGIPGVPGIGATTASALLTRYHHLDDIPADPGAWDVDVRGAARAAATLSEHREDALLYRELATLRTDVVLEETLDDLRWTGVGDDSVDWAREIGVQRLVDRFTATGTGQ